MKKLCEFLREDTMNIINFKKKKMEKVKICYICKDIFENKYLKDKRYCKVRDHCQ